MACNPDCQNACCNLEADRRYVAMAKRLRALRISQLAAIIEETQAGRVLFDTYNFRDGKFCPMAVAFGYHDFYRRFGGDVDEEKVQRFLAQRLYPEPVNILKGMPGKFYHGNDEQRKSDLLWLCRELIKEKL